MLNQRVLVIVCYINALYTLATKYENDGVIELDIFEDDISYFINVKAGNSLYQITLSSQLQYMVFYNYDCQNSITCQLERDSQGEIRQVDYNWLGLNCTAFLANELITLGSHQQVIQVLIQNQLKCIGYRQGTLGLNLPNMLFPQVKIQAFPDSQNQVLGLKEGNKVYVDIVEKIIIDDTGHGTKLYIGNVTSLKEYDQLNDLESSDERHLG